MYALKDNNKEKAGKKTGVQQQHEEPWTYVHQGQKFKDFEKKKKKSYPVEVLHRQEYSICAWNHLEVHGTIEVRITGVGQWS